MKHIPMILVTNGTVENPMSSRRNLSVLYGGALISADLLGAAMLGGDASTLAARFDGLLLSGGGDMDPSLFGQEKHPRAGTPDLARDHEELDLLDAFCVMKKPVFGICRGMQVINVYFGGDISQHIENHDGITHEVTASAGSRLHAACGAKFNTNSYHHQAVNQLGDGIVATAFAADGTIEGIEHDTLPVYGVQWHPERMVRNLLMDTDADHTALFSLLNADVWS